MTMSDRRNLNFDPEDPDDPMWSATQLDCSSCEEVISYDDEIFALTVVAPLVVEEGVIYSPLMAGDDHLYEPCIFHFECWEEDREELREFSADVPPIEDDFAILECGMCGSGIRQEETMAVAVFGEVHISKRDPNGEKSSDTFTGMDLNPDVICIACLNKLDQEVVDELWDSRVAQNEECEEGTFTRCWRHGCSADGSCSFTFEETG
jgi:hypothetical protein